MKINFLIDHTINQKTLKKTETETFGHGEAAPDDIFKNLPPKCTYFLWLYYCQAGLHQSSKFEVNATMFDGSWLVNSCSEYTLIFFRDCKV